MSPRQRAAAARDRRRLGRAQERQEIMKRRGDKATVIVGDSVGELFADTIEDLQIAMLPGDDQPGHNHPVDFELKFKSISVDRGGLIFNRGQEESGIEITLSTRVMPPGE